MKTGIHIFVPSQNMLMTQTFPHLQSPTTKKLFYFCLYYIYTLYMSLEVFQHFFQHILLMALGRLWIYLQDRWQLDQNGYTNSNIKLMELLNASRLDLLHKGLVNDLDLIFCKPLPLLCGGQLYVLFYLWQL